MDLFSKKARPTSFYPITFAYICNMQIHKMRHFKFLILLFAMLTAACEKAYIPSDDQQTNGGNTDDEWHETWETDSTENRCLTVAEAIEAETGRVISVRGYIVGSTSRSMRNAKYLPPFESKTALILSDYKLTECEGFYEDELLPVRIGDFNQYLDALNLVDNPQHFEKLTVITGIKDMYLGQPGIKLILWCDLLEQQ